MKHLKQAPKTLAKTLEKHFKNYCKHMQHTNETLANVRIKHLRTLKNICL
jgi:hypothetical protein